MEALDDKKHQRRSIAGSVTLSLTKIMDFFKTQQVEPTPTTTTTITTPTTPTSNTPTPAITITAAPTTNTTTPLTHRPRTSSPNPVRKSMVLFGGSKLVKSNTTDFGAKNRRELYQQQSQQQNEQNNTTSQLSPQQTTPTKPLLTPHRTEHRKSNSCFDYLHTADPQAIMRHTFTDLSEIKNMEKRKSMKLRQSVNEGPPEPKYGGELRKTRSEPFDNTWDIHSYDELPKSGLTRMASRNFLLPATVEAQRGNSPEPKRHRVKPPDILASDQLMFHTTKDHKSVVKAGNPLAILEWLLFREGTHDEKVIYHAFLLSFSKYVTSADLLHKLLYVFENYETAQKIRAIVLLKTWVESYYHRYFANNEHLVEILVYFISHHVATISQVAATALTTFIAIQRVGGERITELLPLKNEFVDFGTTDFAQQLTIIDHRYFRDIKPWEFLDAVISTSNHSATAAANTAVAAGTATGRTRSIGNNEATNVARFTDWFNKFSMWIAYEIVSTMNKKKQVEVLRRFISLAKKLQEMKNFNSLMAVLSALNMTPVRRLKRLWKKIPKEKKKAFEEAEKMMMPSNNFNNYRVLLATCTPPAVPLVVVHQRDLLFMYDGNPSVLTRNNQKMLNFEKYMMIANCVEDLVKYQYTKYDYEENKTIQSYLHQLITVDEIELRRLSNLCETNTKEQP